MIPLAKKDAKNPLIARQTTKSRVPEALETGRQRSRPPALQRARLRAIGIKIDLDSSASAIGSSPCRFRMTNTGSLSAPTTACSTAC